MNTRHVSELLDHKAAFAAFLSASTSLLLNLGGGVSVSSLALLASASHVLVDVMTCGFVLAMQPSARQGPARRVTLDARLVLASAVNPAVLLLLAVLIPLEAYRRVASPPEIAVLPMFAVASLSLAIRMAGRPAVTGQARDGAGRIDHVRLLTDILVSAGPIVAAAGIWLTGSPVADPILSVILAALLLPRIRLLPRDAIRALLKQDLVACFRTHRSD